MPICFMMGANILLAAERYCILREIPWNRSKKLHFALHMFSFVICTNFLVAFVTSPCSNEVYPDKKLQFYLWLASGGAGFPFGFPLLIYFYWSTYRYITRKLKTSFADHHVDTLRILLQRKALRNSVLMASAVLFCYIPLFAFLGILSSKLVDRNSFAGRIILETCFEIVCLDVLITPCLILYFSQPIARKTRQLWQKQQRHDSEEETEGEGEELWEMR
ncbi:hypothetical protein BDR26DRAFT_868739 [Obelidium mucronatum]|nr:hypothetical protein BDR26DRAFT_868739 [Obelidium mucronatum]